MDTAGPRPSAAVPSTRWSLLAGVYAFLCSAVMFLPLRPVVTTLVTILTLPPASAAFVVPGSAAVAGAVAWWAVVERRGAYTYLLGGVAGLTTVLLTALLWTLPLGVIYGPSSVLVGGVVILFALVVAAPVAVTAGVSLMHARRRFGRVSSESG